MRLLDSPLIVLFVRVCFQLIPNAGVQIFSRLRVNVTTSASVVTYCQRCLIGTEVGYGSEIFTRRLIIVIDFYFLTTFLVGLFVFLFGGAVMLSLENL